MMDFGERLREVLNDRSMTQEQLARKALISKSTVYMYINCGVLPTADNLKAVCEVLDVSADYLLGLERRL